jgi:hypothetical protein
MSLHGEEFPVSEFDAIQSSVLKFRGKRDRFKELCKVLPPW